MAIWFLQLLLSSSGLTAASCGVVPSFGGPRCAAGVGGCGSVDRLAAGVPWRSAWGAAATTRRSFAPTPRTAAAAAWLSPAPLRARRGAVLSSSRAHAARAMQTRPRPTGLARAARSTTRRDSVRLASAATASATAASSSFASHDDDDEFDDDEAAAARGSAAVAAAISRIYAQHAKECDSPIARAFFPLVPSPSAAPPPPPIPPAGGGDGDDRRVGGAAAVAGGVGAPAVDVAALELETWAPRADDGGPLLGDDGAHPFGRHPSAPLIARTRGAARVFSRAELRAVIDDAERYWARCAAESGDRAGSGRSRFTYAAGNLDLHVAEALPATSAWLGERLRDTLVPLLEVRSRDDVAHEDRHAPITTRRNGRDTLVPLVERAIERERGA